jgi:hypothetical protein
MSSSVTPLTASGLMHHRLRAQNALLSEYPLTWQAADHVLLISQAHQSQTRPGSSRFNLTSRPSSSI